jgi:hypothetical protein
MASSLRRNPFIDSATIELQAADTSSQKERYSVYDDFFLTLVEKNLPLG